MELCYKFDPHKFYLGTKCINNHIWPGTELSLRKIYKSPSGVTVNHCAGCQTTRKNWLDGFIDNEAMGIPPGYALRKLCPKGHRWNESSYTLRRNGKCLECEKIRHASEDYKKRNAAHRVANKELLNVKARERWNRLLSEDPLKAKARMERRRIAVQEKRKKNGRESRSKYGLPHGYCKQNQLSRQFAPVIGQLHAQGLSPQAIRETLAFMEHVLKNIKCSPTVLCLVDEAQKLYWKENPDVYQEIQRKRRQEYHRWRYLTDEAYRLYHRQKSKRKKALMRGSIGFHITGKQVQERFRQFGHCCAYCGCSGELHIEHVIPISMGGPHVMSNVVPACVSCNYSKRDTHVELWYRSQSFFCEKRWRKICKFLGIGKGSSSQLAFL